MKNTCYHSFKNPFVVASSLLRGKSLIRTLFNISIREWELSGDVLDLGSKTATASYYQYFKKHDNLNLTLTDINPSEKVLMLNVEEPFPLPDESYDIILAFHLFEHVYNLSVAPKEITRALRHGGKFFVSMPFWHQYHADPDDYYRFTDSALRRWGESAGLSCVHMEAIGEGIVTTMMSKLPLMIMPRFCRPLFSAFLYLVATILDRLIVLRPQIDGKSAPQLFALEHFAVFEKKS